MRRDNSSHSHNHSYSHSYSPSSYSHRHGHSYSLGGAPKPQQLKTLLHQEQSNSDEDLALFHELRAREDNATDGLHLSNIDIDASLSTKYGGLSGYRLPPTDGYSSTHLGLSSNGTRTSLLGTQASTPAHGLLVASTESGKTDYDWLLTPPGTPLFPSLEKDNGTAAIAVDTLAPVLKRNFTRSNSVSRSARHSYSHEPSPNRSSRRSPSPNAGTLSRSASRGRNSASPNASPKVVMNGAMSSRRGSPIPPRTPSSTSPSPILRRMNTSPVIRARSAERPNSSHRSNNSHILSSSPSSSRHNGARSSSASSSRANSVSPKAKVRNPPPPISSLLGFSFEAPPNLRTSMTPSPDRAGLGSPVRGLVSRQSSKKALSSGSKHNNNSNNNVMGRYPPASPSLSVASSSCFSLDRPSSQTSKSSSGGNDDNDSEISVSLQTSLQRDDPSTFDDKRSNCACSASSFDGMQGSCNCKISPQLSNSLSQPNSPFASSRANSLQSWPTSPVLHPSPFPTTNTTPTTTSSRQLIKPNISEDSKNSNESGVEEEEEEEEEEDDEDEDDDEEEEDMAISERVCAEEYNLRNEGEEVEEESCCCSIKEINVDAHGPKSSARKQLDLGFGIADGEDSSNNNINDSKNLFVDSREDENAKPLSREEAEDEGFVDIREDVFIAYADSCDDGRDINKEGGKNGLNTCQQEDIPLDRNLLRVAVELPEKVESTTPSLVAETITEGHSVAGCSAQEEERESGRVALNDSKPCAKQYNGTAHSIADACSSSLQVKKAHSSLAYRVSKADEQTLNSSSESYCARSVNSSEADTITRTKDDTCSRLLQVKKMHSSPSYRASKAEDQTLDSSSESSCYRSVNSSEATLITRVKDDTCSRLPQVKITHSSPSYRVSKAEDQMLDLASESYCDRSVNSSEANTITRIKDEACSRLPQVKKTHSSPSYRVMKAEDQTLNSSSESSCDQSVNSSEATPITRSKDDACFRLQQVKKIHSSPASRVLKAEDQKLESSFESSCDRSVNSTEANTIMRSKDDACFRSQQVKKIHSSPAYRVSKAEDKALDLPSESSCDRSVNSSEATPITRSKDQTNSSAKCDYKEAGTKAIILEPKNLETAVNSGGSASQVNTDSIDKSIAIKNTTMEKKSSSREKLPKPGGEKSRDTSVLAPMKSSFLNAAVDPSFSPIEAGSDYHHVGLSPQQNIKASNGGESKIEVFSPADKDIPKVKVLHVSHILQDFCSENDIPLSTAPRKGGRDHILINGLDSESHYIPQVEPVLPKQDIARHSENRQIAINMLLPPSQHPRKSVCLDEEKQKSYNSGEMAMVEGNSNDTYPPMLRNVTLAEATEIILLCSSIMHDLVDRATTLAESKENQTIMEQREPMGLVTPSSGLVNHPSGQHELEGGTKMVTTTSPVLLQPPHTILVLKDNPHQVDKLKTSTDRAPIVTDHAQKSCCQCTIM